MTPANLDTVDNVEQLLSRLLADWEIDAYVRLDVQPHDHALSPAVSAGVSAEELESLVESPLLSDLCDRARRGGTMVVENDLSSGSDRPVLMEIGFTALAVCPIEGLEESAGFLLFASRHARSLSESTLGRLQEFSRIVLSYSTEKDQSGRQLRRLVIQLTEAEDRERRRIAALLHDDLQQTLAGIKVHLDMAARRAEGDSYVSNRLRTAVILLEEAIGRSRTLSHELNPPALRNRGLVAALKTLAAETHQTHDLEVRVLAPEETIPMSELAKSVAYRAVQELLFNIVKHAGVDDATIDVRLIGEGLEISVRDRGHGFNVDEALKRDSPTGLGLISVRERLEAIGGVLQIESLPNAGSTLTIFLPTRGMQAQGTLTQRAADHGEHPAERKTSIVLVDDHAVIRQGIALLLNEEPDLEVVGEADTGADAVELVRQLRPDVVVMDLTMPGMNGDEATRRILAESPTTRVIGLSMHSEREAEEAMLAAGAVAYLPKAGPSSDLIASIRGDAAS